MKKIILFFLFFFVSAFADTEENVWNLHRINIYSENDVLSGTDQDYTNGFKLSFIYDIKNPEGIIYKPLQMDEKYFDTYISLSVAQHIYTPKRENQLYTELVQNDRPYAGWSYLEAGIYKASSSVLRSLTVQVGIVGDAAKAKEIQNYVHDFIEVERFYGWENQLKNELGLNLTYVHKEKFYFNAFDSIESFISPYFQADFGNVSIKATTGFMSRFGLNLPKDFGHSTIQTNNENGINTYKNKDHAFKNIGLSININAGVDFIVRDIFLDGNTFEDSHSVSKKHIVGYLSYGFGLIYKKFTLDFLERLSSKKFDQGISDHKIYSLVGSWRF